MNRPITIFRLVDSSRVEELHALVTAAFSGLAIDPPSGVLKETVADFRDRLQREIALVAQVQDSVGAPALVGSVFCANKGNSLYIGRLAVRDDFRRQGVASALLEAAKAEARGLGIGRMTLSARIALKSNVALFERHGFAVVAATAHPGFVHPTSYDMELVLA
jgi:predicted N-acetyltransferase YhbS